MPAGMLIVGNAEARKWKPNEAYFLQAIGDQMLMSVSHTRLRSLVRRMGVSDERSGLLSRSSYQSCLLTEADRARTQGTPLALTILQIDRGAELLRQQGESPLERFFGATGAIVAADREAKRRGGEIYFVVSGVYPAGYDARGCAESGG